jgi:hypothetical protein
MDYLEKILFIDLTCTQLGRPTTDHPDYVSTWQSLSQIEKDEYVKLSSEIHEIWTYVNMPKIIDLKNKKVNSVFEYNEIIEPVNLKILTICTDFGITLKEELTNHFLKIAKRILGKDYLTWFDDK